MYRYIRWDKQTTYQFFKRHWRILTSDPDLQGVLTMFLSIPYRRGNNIRYMVVHSHYGTPATEGTWLRSKTTGSFSFSRSLPKKKQIFKNSQGDREFTIRQFMNYKSEAIIYRAQCSCPKTCVGKTIQQFYWQTCEFYYYTCRYSYLSPYTLLSQWQCHSLTIGGWQLVIQYNR